VVTVVLLFVLRPRDEGSDAPPVTVPPPEEPAPTESAPTDTTGAPVPDTTAAPAP
jgi:hypothetical protein